MQDLGTKVAMVTGASRGFGRATALVLARHGADVVVVYRDADAQAEHVAEEIRRLGTRAQAMRADVSIPEECDLLARHAIERFGRIDILVNNAGVMDVSAFVTQDSDCWERMIAVNIRGVLALTRATLPSMCQSGSGRIVNLASQLAHTGAENFGVYAGTKAFVLAFTKSLAREVGPAGVTVNAVCPGSIVTDMNRGIYPPRAQREKAEVLPLRRMGDPDDVGQAVLYLVAESGRFVTGQCIEVNGGNTMP